MKHNKKRISKIVDELMMYLFSIGATDINVNIQDREQNFKICIKSNYRSGQDDKINTMIKQMKCPKREEVEEYYWELTGESDVGSELSLVAMMIDEVEINYDDNTLEMVLHRYK